jgi:hypothetical protein
MTHATRLSTALLLAAATVATSPAAAQSSRLAAGTQPTVHVGVAGGVVIPRTGASARTIENGLHGQAFALVRLPGGLPTLRLNVDYDHMRFGRPTTGTTSATGTADAPDATRTLIDGVAGLHLDLLHGPVRPYVVAGVGAFNVRDRLRDAALSAAAGGTSAAALASLEQSTTNLGVDGGAGVAFRLGRIDGFVESRLRNVYTRQRGLVDTRSIQSFPIAFGLTF